MSELKLLTVNCQGLRSKQKYFDVLDYLKNHNCDIYCLQDTHTTSDLENSMRSAWNGEIVFNSYKSNARGVAIMFNKNLEANVF